LRQSSHSQYQKSGADLIDTIIRKNRDEGDHFGHFLKLFDDCSTKEESEEAARKMKKIVEQKENGTKALWLSVSLHHVARASSERLRWPNSPVLVIMDCLNLNHVVQSESGGAPWGPLRDSLSITLVRIVHPKVAATYKNQIILARQLIENGAVNLNELYSHNGSTALHCACHDSLPTNLEFIQLLLENGADPNVKDKEGSTPLFKTIPFAPAAAKCLVQWAGTDVNMTHPINGGSILAIVKGTIMGIVNGDFSSADTPEKKAEKRFLIRQWREVEQMLLKRGAV
jgi:hypothetical protein